MNVRTVFAIFWILTLLFTASCRNKEKPKSNRDHVLTRVAPQKDYLSLIISLDTLSPAQYKKAIYRENDLLKHVPDSSTNSFYHFFRAKKYNLEKKRDSALAEYKKMNEQQNDDVALFKNFLILNHSLGSGAVEATLTNQILSGMQTAERSKSRITYLFYDLLARAYFQNDNTREAFTYAERYYKNHPFKLHPVIKQRYYDISFLLASDMGNFDKMMLYNVKARNLAKSIGDSLAIARTYDNEARIYDRQGQYDKTLMCSRIYFNYLKKTNNLNDIAYNNLATSFMRNKQLDSAIYYYNGAIDFLNKNEPGNPKSASYKGLIEAYKIKGDYNNAFRLADYTYALEIKEIKRIEAVKVAELHEKYETEKKDRNIAELNSRNVLNEKIILQQRWTLGLAFLIFLGVLSFFYIIYRQQRLKERNKLLQSENQRLNIEQKLLQAQLNPHFIFNAIANLQGLVTSGDTREFLRYLAAFSKLLRSILEQSRKDFIDLDEEISSLDNYLQLQQMRFTGLFEYHITADDNLSLENILIPPMLIQPFVENSIEHGFRNIQHKGILNIIFKVENDQLVINVDDNGSGLTRKEIPKQKKQSLAQIILKERLDVLFKSKGLEAKFVVEDKKNTGGQGVLVQIVIPVVKD
ncbi:histidine kinase [Pedobacter punctiformis]|uniref:Histidine kinase n=1 Tax=Pedobacter punctiformis TaxID=3004097 RepID=A0ABT4L6P1_9SPHI|nr:histidine kinase [Pedobacter sp. HCMS5-2]MCZ4243589.1 histidine kinase [Pedobacter sp. HCMS5-2]